MRHFLLLQQATIRIVEIFLCQNKVQFFFSLGGVVLTHNLTLSARSGTTVPHQVASKTTAPTSPRLSLANQISFPSHVDGQAMLIVPQDQIGTSLAAVAWLARG